MDPKLVNAIRLDNDKIVKEILDSGTDVNTYLPGSPWKTLLWQAVEEEAEDVAELLLERGANPNVMSPTAKNTVLMRAVAKGLLDTTTNLLRKGADPNLKNAENVTALFLGMESPDIIYVLVQYGADPTIPVTDNQGTVYMYIMRDELYDTADALLDAASQKGIPLNDIVNAVDADGSNVAFYVEGERGVQELANRGVDFNHKNNNGNTPLMTAMTLNDGGETALEMLQFNADVNLASDEGISPLMEAIRLELPDVVAVDLIEAGANVNHKRPADGYTALMYATQRNNKDIVELLLESGADKSIKNNAGETAFDLAKNDTIRELLAEEESSAPWTGLTRSDVAIFDTFFAPGPAEDPEANKINWSCCPVCLAYVYRSEACRYMSHNCSQQPGVVMHKRLYDLYKKANNMIEWCTVCGRVCNGHHHYMLAPHESPERAPMAPYNPAAVFHFGGEAECLQDGGGGLAEKVKRLDRLRTWAKELQSEVGKKTEKRARLELIEEAWNAPLARAPTARILQEGKFTVPATEFPEGPAPAAAPEGPAPDIPKPADEVANVPEIIEAGGFDVILQYETAPVARFIHKKKDGTVYRHTDQELISKEGLEAYIANQNTNFGLPNFGYCFAPGCDAKLWPQDVKDLIDDAAVYEDYRKKFNEKFQGMQGGAGKPLFVLATGIECPKKTAGRKTYRRRMNRKKTIRKNKWRR